MGEVVLRKPVGLAHLIRQLQVHEVLRVVQNL